MRMPLHVLAHVQRLRWFSGVPGRWSGWSPAFVLVPCLREPCRIFDCTGCGCGGPALFTGPGCRADGSKVMAVVAGVCEDNVFLVVVGVSA